MPFTSRAYRILIASPSDVEEEREIAVRVIQEWNDLYSYSRGVVLLPLRWETHSAPEYGTRPQEVINRAVVDQCDLLLGVFWTRIGTPTGAAESGTLEEIARVAKAGKPIMLYFSKVGADPDRIDLEQFKKLKTFKEDVYPNALTESYKSHIEFRDKFAKQLELKVRDLQRDDASGPPPLALSIASQDLKSLDGPSARRTVQAIEVVDLDTGLGTDPKIAERLRGRIEACVQRSAMTPTVLVITNAGSSGFRNLYVEMDITGTSDLSITDKEPSLPSLLGDHLFYWNFLDEPQSQSEWKNLGVALDWEKSPSLAEGFTKTDTGWRLTFEWPALQPRRQRLVVPVLFVSARTNGTVRFLAKVFADSLPDPVSLEAKLELAVRNREVKVVDLVGNVEKLATEH